MWRAMVQDFIHCVPLSLPPFTVSPPKLPSIF